MTIPKITNAEILCSASETESGKRLRLALAELRRSEPTAFVETDEKLLDYLNQRREFESVSAPRLIIIAGDTPPTINTATLDQIRADEILAMIPLVVLTSPANDAEIQALYSRGVNSVIAMPESFDDLVWLMRSLAQYWLKVSETPSLGAQD